MAHIYKTFDWYEYVVNFRVLSERALRTAKRSASTCSVWRGTSTCSRRCRSRAAPAPPRRRRPRRPPSTPPSSAPAPRPSRAAAAPATRRRSDRAPPAPRVTAAAPARARPRPYLYIVNPTVQWLWQCVVSYWSAASLHPELGHFEPYQHTF